MKVINLRSGPIWAVLIILSNGYRWNCPPECNFQSETKIEPDLRLEGNTNILCNFFKSLSFSVQRGEKMTDVKRKFQRSSYFLKHLVNEKKKRKTTGLVWNLHLVKLSPAYSFFKCSLSIAVLLLQICNALLPRLFSFSKVIRDCINLR